MAPTADGKGYWLSNSVGQVSTTSATRADFGDAYDANGSARPAGGTAPDVARPVVKGEMFTTTVAAVDVRVAEEAGRRLTDAGKAATGSFWPTSRRC